MNGASLTPTDRLLNAVAEADRALEESQSSSVLTRRSVQFLFLVIVGAAGTAALRALGPLQEAVRVALSLSDNQMALLQGPALALPMVIAGIPLGHVIDRYSRVRFLLVLAVMQGVGCLLSAFGPNFATLFVGRCVVGLSSLAMTIAIYSLLADLFPPVQRGRAKAIAVIGQYAGSSTAFALGGLLLARFDSANGWQSAMFWLTAPLFAASIALLLVIREPPRSGVELRETSLGSTLGEFWRCRSLLLPLIAGIVLAEMPLFAIVTWAAPALSRSFALPPQKVGGIMAVVMMVGGVAGPFLGGALADLCHRTGGPRRTIRVLSWLVACGGLGALFSLTPQLWMASVLLVVFIVMAQASASMGVTLFLVVVPNELRGLSLAVLSAAAALFCMGLIPLVISFLSSALGGPAMIGKALGMVCIAAGLLCAATFAFGMRPLSSETPRPCPVSFR